MGVQDGPYEASCYRWEPASEIISQSPIRLLRQWFKIFLNQFKASAIKISFFSKIFWGWHIVTKYFFLFYLLHDLKIIKRIKKRIKPVMVQVGVARNCRTIHADTFGWIIVAFPEKKWCNEPLFLESCDRLENFLETLWHQGFSSISPPAYCENMPSAQTVTLTKVWFS